MSQELKASRSAERRVSLTGRASPGRKSRPRKSVCLARATDGAVAGACPAKYFVHLRVDRGATGSRLRLTNHRAGCRRHSSHPVLCARDSTGRLWDYLAPNQPVRAMALARPAFRRKGNRTCVRRHVRARPRRKNLARAIARGTLDSTAARLTFQPPDTTDLSGVEANSEQKCEKTSHVRPATRWYRPHMPDESGVRLSFRLTVLDTWDAGSKAESLVRERTRSAHHISCIAR